MCRIPERQSMSIPGRDSPTRRILTRRILTRATNLTRERFSPERKNILTRGTEYQDGIGESASGKNAHPKAAIPETESMTLGYIEGRL